MPRVVATASTDARDGRGAGAVQYRDRFDLAAGFSSPHRSRSAALRAAAAQQIEAVGVALGRHRRAVRDQFAARLVAQLSRSVARFTLLVGLARTLVPARVAPAHGRHQRTEN